MSVFLKIFKVTLEERPKGNVVLAVRTKNQEIISEKVSGGSLNEIQLSFLVPYTTKCIIFEIREEKEGAEWTVIGKTQYCLYNIREIKEGEKAMRMLLLQRQQLGAIIVNDYVLHTGSIALQLSHSTKRRILTEIQRIYLSPKYARKGEQINQTQVLEQRFQEISVITTKAPQPTEKEDKKQCKLNGEALKQRVLEETVYEVDNDGYITLKPNKPNKLEAQFEEVLQKIIESSEITQKELTHPFKVEPNEEKNHHQKIKQITSYSPSKATGQPLPAKVTPKKPQIFQTIPDLQPAHINLNPSSNMFEVYTMCCGQEIDRSHEVSSYY